jgi:general secretion pathway protein G
MKRLYSSFKREKDNKGFTLIELIVVIIIISTLAVISIPIIETSIKREMELELRRNLRIIREALDEYNSFLIKNKIKFDKDTYGYPEKLEILVKGVEYRDKKNKLRIKKFLRSIPYDPMIKSKNWGKRSYQDKRDSNHWGGENIWDVYSKSEKTALNGTKYSDW